MQDLTSLMNQQLSQLKLVRFVVFSRLTSDNIIEKSIGVYVKKISAFN